MRVLVVVGEERAYLVFYTGSSAFQQPIDVLTNMCSLRRCMRQRDGLVERDARFVGAAELVQPRAFRAEEVEVTLQLVAQRLDHFESGSGTAQLGDGNCAIER